MTKMQLVLTSVVAAVPGAIVTYLMVMGFLGYADQMTGLVMSVAGITLAAGAAVTLSPVGIFLFLKEEAAPEAEEAGAEDTEEEAEEDAIFGEEEPALADDETAEGIEEFDEFAEPAEVVGEEGEEDVFSDEEFDAFDELEFDEDDEQKG